MTNFLASHCIFLIRENETGKSSVLNVVDRSTSRSKNTAADGQLDVTKAKWGAKGIRGVGLEYSPGRLR
jgi:hypothetical protein